MSRLFQILLFGEKQRTVWARLLMVALLAVLCRFIWSSHQSDIVNQQNYILTANNVKIESIPEWISPDFKDYVFYLRIRTDKKPFNILDADIADQIGRTFERHPWVEQVESVKIAYPARAVLNIHFRDPVAFIETPGKDKKKSGFLVDSEGIVLPSEYFIIKQELLQKFFYIEGVNTKPFLKDYGENWGDHNVAEVALLASFLVQDKEFFDLDRIRVKISEDSRDLNQYRIYTKKGLEIIWGSFPIPGNLQGENDIGSRERKENLKRNLFEKQLPKLDRLRSLRGSHDKSLDNIPAKERPVDVSKEVE